jgi:hypothetical protein
VKIQMTRCDGLTLAELIISMGLLVVLTGLLAAVYGNSYSSFRRGTTRMHVNQQAREVVRRITPMVMCAKPINELEEAILLPEIGNSGPALEFTTADHVLEDMAPINARNPIHYRFLISHDADLTVKIQELNLSTGAPTGTPRILAHNVAELDFSREAVNLVRLRVVTSDEIRNASNQLEEVRVERSAILAVPYYSSTR